MSLKQGFFLKFYIFYCLPIKVLNIFFSSKQIHQPFWCPTQITINNKTTEYNLPPNDKGFYNYVNSAGLHYEAKEVHRCVKEGNYLLTNIITNFL